MRGKNFEIGITAKDVAKEVRKYTRKHYPKCRFSITSKSGVLYIRLMSAPFKVFTRKERADGYLFEGYAQINEYDILEKRAPYLTQPAVNMLYDVLAYAESFNYDSSDIMTDYFDVNFYVRVSIGSFEKPFKEALNV